MYLLKQNLFKLSKKWLLFVCECVLMRALISLLAFKRHVLFPPPPTISLSGLEAAVITRQNIKTPNRSEPRASEAHEAHGKPVRPGAASSLSLFVKSDFEGGNNWQYGAFEKAEGCLFFFLPMPCHKIL